MEVAGSEQMAGQSGQNMMTKLEHAVTHAGIAGSSKRGPFAQRLGSPL